jgi:DNA-binding GntR family transcriptional regulator
MIPNDDDTRVRAGLFRYVREAVAANRPLLGEIELARQLQASRQQVRNALSALERQGIVRRRQGAQTVVDPIALRMSVRLEEQLEHSELLARLGYRPTVEVVESGFVSLPSELVPLLTSDAGDTAFRVVKRWMADDRPAMLAVNHVAFPHGVPEQMDERESVFAIAERVWGESIVWEVATPGVRILNAAEAQSMTMEVGAPVLTIEILGTAVSGRTTFHAFEMHNPDIVSYSFARTLRPPWSARYRAD